MSYKQYRKRKRERTLQEIATGVKNKYYQLHGNKRTQLVPHPTLPNTFIEREYEADN